MRFLVTFFVATNIFALTWLKFEAEAASQDIRAFTPSSSEKTEIKEIPLSSANGAKEAAPSPSMHAPPRKEEFRKEAFQEAQKAPLTIDSTQGMHCDKQANSCTALGNVKVSKGPFTLYSDKATAFLRENNQGKREIYRTISQGNVKFVGDPGEIAYANSASFDTDHNHIVLKEPHPEFAQFQRPVVQKGQYLLLADHITIVLAQTASQKQQVKEILAKNHVILSSPTEIVFGDNASYTPATQIALLTGDVILNRPEGILHGQMAEVNLDTGISKMLKVENSPEGRGRSQAHAVVNPQKIEKESLPLRRQKMKEVLPENGTSKS